MTVFCAYELPYHAKLYDRRDIIVFEKSFTS